MVRYGKGFRKYEMEQRYEGAKGAKSERSEAMRQDELKSEFWGKTSFFFGVDTKVLNTNDK